MLGGAQLDDQYGKQVSDWRYTAGAPGAASEGRTSGLHNYFLSRNSDSAATVAQLEMSIQSSIGAYTYSSESWPFIRNRQALWRDHLKYCVDGYCNSSFDTWTRHNSCLLLGADSFLRGLTTTNTSFPCQFDIKVRFENRRQFITGDGAAAALGNSPAVQQDLIQGTPVAVLLYTGASLQISPSSALLTSANLSHAQSLETLSRG